MRTTAQSALLEKHSQVSFNLQAGLSTRVWLGSEMSGFMTAFAINMCHAYPRPEVFG